MNPDLRNTTVTAEHLSLLTSLDQTILTTLTANQREQLLTMARPIWAEPLDPYDGHELASKAHQLGIIDRDTADALKSSQDNYVAPWLDSTEAEVAA